ncbi:isocitrate lyase/phosphoenolpyruvate mutase family protein [Rhizobium anhuiense]|jgi:2-methylisocitrate lyase-like PEP mutase family enzyme|uniref:Isocitrate lyase/phosphoenolpyruvate mutase family protein n=1 Tax=Rhizobium anhuiense TaxID=1184720 RepID=A0ABX4JC08_9HYPH|nr:MULTISPECIES: isocitrate lyase/phosphoenolpyruvate mutase family protein [Rhizobium]KZS53118.1 phosphonomutase [Rhizobium anhuiense bv. trifolii]MBB3299046.1 2-methylisocitrate lyase-like PEP mutase family enzyme [Rhizobium sp. BK112]MBB3368231.1 2-methylisocitrate lyase-like PEP mutase family enzyme [Rhizobium sp. BK077]MBB3744540.1 2-methylisocitrate lyase-like PEP mutase family enzyme [Rhizobium sp. BK591]MBB4114441.1 2-methylisocitrate lyase-like PEP mutase family enzyme [Rhizobium sp. 
MNQNEKAKAFGALHRKGDPVVLYNIWDAGTAKAVADAGAKALATGSWSVAAAHGYADGEKLPMSVLVETAKSITSVIDLPLSVDFEGAYSAEPEGAAANVAKLVEVGAVGINFEDQVVAGSGLYPIDRQAARIRAIRAMAEAKGIAFFINARTDLFLAESDLAKHAGLVDEAIERGRAYAAAGGSGFFVPGLIDPALIEKICAASPLPVNVMMRTGAPDVKTLAGLGVGRISYGPGPYRSMMDKLKQEAAAIYSQL